MRPWVRWLAFVLWVLVIFAAVPFANEIQAWIGKRLGAGFLRYALTALVAVAAVGGGIWLARRSPKIDLRRAAWIAAVAAVALAATWGLSVAAEPAHLAEYAVLGALAFWALSAHYRDAGVYLAAAAATAIVGTLDEVFQWLLPGRFWGLGDVAINVAAGVLVQLVIWGGVRPQGVASGVGARSLRLAARLAAGFVALLALCLANTPARIEWYAQRIPGLGYLGKDLKTRMVEYGHLYDDPEIGRFRSRFAPERLRQTDRRRGASAGKVLDRLGRPDGYGRLQRLYRPSRDPLAFEALGHLFYRERLSYRAEREGDPVARRRLATIAYRENLILERYFTRTLARSTRTLDPEERRRLEELHLPEAEFESEVGDWLLTGVREAQALSYLSILLIGLLLVERSCARRLDD